MTSHDVVPAVPERWGDLAVVMGTRGDPSRCWCQYFHLRGRAWSEATAPSLRERLYGQVIAGDRPPGVLAYTDGEPVGWCQVGPKSSYARLLSSPASAPPDDDADPAGLWSITCFVVSPKARRHGVATALLDGALAFAAAYDAASVEAYPVDTAARSSTSSAELYHGALTLFVAAGFEVVRRPSSTRAVVRRQTIVA